jgi:hypothetical protein
MEWKQRHTLPPSALSEKKADAKRRSEREEEGGGFCEEGDGVGRVGGVGASLRASLQASFPSTQARGGEGPSPSLLPTVQEVVRHAMRSRGGHVRRICVR